MSTAPFELTFTSPKSALPLFEEAFSETAGAILTSEIETGPQKGLWNFQAIFEKEPDQNKMEQLIKEIATHANIDLPDIAIKQMPDINWLEASYQGFPPISVGQFYIYGSHIQEDLPTDQICLKIDAATAFGTGEHQTTHGCLQALSDMDTLPEHVLDVGCGSGILSMAYAKRTGNKVDAVDIDPESIRVTLENAQQNHLEKQISAWESDGYQSVPRKYDLIFCNILAKPLIQLAPDLKEHLNSGGKAILSGFLVRQERWVKQAHERIGLHKIKGYRVKGWSTIVVQKDDSKQYPSS